MFVLAVRRISRVSYIPQQEIREIEQTPSITCKDPHPFLGVKLAKKTELAPFHLDVIVGHLGMRRLLLTHHAAHVESTRDDNYKKQ
jgi:hypothetical protein